MQPSTTLPPAPDPVSPSRKRAGAPGSRLPHLKLPPKTSTTESGLPSPSTPVRETKPDLNAPPKSPTKPKAPALRLPAFRTDWERLIHTGHPNRDEGLLIIDDLIQMANLENPRGIAHYSYDANHEQPDLAKLVQIDLSALTADRLCMLVDQRAAAHKTAVLYDGDDVRAALGCGAPVALDLSAGPRGLLRARVAPGPPYRAVKPGSTLVGGQGVFALALPKYGHQAVLTQVVGQCVLLDFPTTPENQSMLAQHREAAVPDYRRLFKWARQQPGACVRVLQPGDHVFMPALQARLVISLGYNGSSYSATALTYVGNDFADADDERRRKKPKTE